MSMSNEFELPFLQELQSPEQIELLDVIDSLRSQGFRRAVTFPQLVVCGDQSSGKSSVLEAISGIPFPSQETLCTQFATEVVLRRAVKNAISVSIVPGEDRASPELDQLLKFKHELTTHDDFDGLFKEARSAMGLSGSEKFSSDILRIEFRGPSQPQLTLVDLPGLIQLENRPETTGDGQLINNLVLQYLKAPQSIILAVVSSKNDISDLAILRRAREADPRGLRTIGVITKPDTLLKGSTDEKSFLTLARNEYIKLSLGWHVVKNFDSAVERDRDHSRDELEGLFFKESCFNKLPTNTVGIASLRNRLSRVLFDHIRTELPSLADGIQSQIITAKQIQDRLGSIRSDFEEQRLFLISLSESFQSICRDAVRGDYGHEFFQDDMNPKRRLSANVMNLHLEFAKTMRLSGASWIIVDEKTADPKHRTRKDAITEAYKLLNRSRGRELPGLPNPLLVGELFRDYSRPWEGIARRHIKNVWEATSRFLELVIQYIADEDTCEKVLRLWLYPTMDGMLNSAFEKLNELLEVHKDHPLTTNYHFINDTKRLKETESKRRLEEILKKEFTQPNQKVAIDDINRLLSNMGRDNTPDMDMIAAEEAFNNMNAFYEVAMNLFTDNVPTLAIQALIIREIPKIFCPTAVFSMDADLVKKIAGESEKTSQERATILRRLEILEEGVRICKQYAKRPQSSTYSVGLGSPILSKQRSSNGIISISRESPAGSSIFTNSAPPKALHSSTSIKASKPNILELEKESQISRDPIFRSAPSLFSSLGPRAAESGKDRANSSTSSGLFSSPGPRAAESGKDRANSSTSSGLFSSLGPRAAESGKDRANPSTSSSFSFGSGSNRCGENSLFGSRPPSEAKTANKAASIFETKSSSAADPRPTVPSSGSETLPLPAFSGIFSNKPPPISAQARIARKATEARPAMISPPSTLWTPYRPHLYHFQELGLPGLEQYQNISSMMVFNTFSPEELRLADYSIADIA